MSLDAILDCVNQKKGTDTPMSLWIKRVFNMPFSVAPRTKGTIVECSETVSRKKSSPYASMLHEKTMLKSCHTI